MCMLHRAHMHVIHFRFPEICNTSCFGKGNLKPVISDLNCTGNEIDISQCSFRNVDRVCGNVLGIFCSELSICLYNYLERRMSRIRSYYKKIQMKYSSFNFF